jgi:uncharacterized protein (DUF433 family)
MPEAQANRIVLDPAVLGGKPIIAGTRLSVEFVLGLLADGWTEVDMITNYAGLKKADIAACLAHKTH